MEYNISTAINAPTDIYFNHELHYPHGARVTINGMPVTFSNEVVSGISVQCSVDGAPISVQEDAEQPYTNHVLLKPVKGAQDKQSVKVTISRCGLSDACTCRR